MLGLRVLLALQRVLKVGLDDRAAPLGAEPLQPTVHPLQGARVDLLLGGQAAFAGVRRLLAGSAGLAPPSAPPRRDDVARPVALPAQPTGERQGLVGRQALQFRVMAAADLLEFLFRQQPSFGREFDSHR
ncbi:MAG: hypothetical protein NVV74_09350 [Magnetospirillum sp.]|nr:hypothetical protein [Magnetospirillum sp.]